jgi:hypothetical protein
VYILLTLIDASLLAHDQSAAEMLSWMKLAKSTALELQTCDSEGKGNDMPLYAAVEELESKVETYQDIVDAFLEISLDKPNAASASYRALRSKANIVKSSWMQLLSLISTVRGSSAERLRESEFTDAADNVATLLNEARTRLASLLMADTDPSTLFSELEGELDGLIAPYIADLREKAAMSALSVAERDRYIRRQRALAEEFDSLAAWIERERKENDTCSMIRRVERGLEDVLRMQAEFAKVIQETALALSQTSSLVSSNKNDQSIITVADLERMESSLDARFDWYDHEVSALLKSLQQQAEETGLQPKHTELLAKWASMKGIKSNISNQLRKQANAKRESIRNARSQIGRNLVSPSMLPVRSPSVQYPTVSPLRTPSPATSRAISALSSVVSSPSRPTSSKGSGLPVKIFLPSSNHYGKGLYMTFVT